MSIVQIHSPHPLSLGTPGAAAFDVRSAEDVVFWPGRLVAVSTGIYSQFPPSLAAVLKFERGGLGMKGFEIKAGLVDSDYRGEWKVLLKWNPPIPEPPLDNQKVAEFYQQRMRINKGDRIAQVFFMNRPEIELEYVEKESLVSTARGEGCFGSTGV